MEEIEIVHLKLTITILIPLGVPTVSIITYKIIQKCLLSNMADQILYDVPSPM